MLHITDEMVEQVLTARDAQMVLSEAFRLFANKRASMQERIRTECGGVKISTMAAVIPELGVAGAKVYTTIAGQFRFIITLFATDDGRPLAFADAGAITRLRTAATSVLAARVLARAESTTLALFGAGVQGSNHLLQFSQEFALRQVRVCDPFASPKSLEALQARCGIPLVLSTPEQALEGADIVITASRSENPLFAGSAVPDGCFIAAIGSSLPHTRELDDDALRRADIVCVEWRTQSLREAGDLQAAGQDDVLPHHKVVDLGELLTGVNPGRTYKRQVTIYKSVGVALQDVAVAALAYERVTGRLLGS